MSRVVIVTGASTGIGAATAVRLAGAGWRVYAGVRREADGEALSTQAPGTDLRPIRVDVTDADALASAARRVAEENDGRLDGLVNNAGIAVAGPLELVPLDLLRRQFEVNVVGQVASTQAFIPALRAARGRIVFMSSVGGRVGQPFVGPYTGSKHALEAIGDALRMELRPWGIRVSLIEPGAVRTPIWDKGQRDADDLLGQVPEAEGLYGAAIERMRELAREEARRGVPPERVAAAVEHALTSARPRQRYPVGPEARVLLTTRRVLPGRAVDELILRVAKLPR